MVSCLEDAIDAIQQDALPTSEASHHCFMMCLETALDLTQDMERTCHMMSRGTIPHIESVDIFQDARVWVGLDDGCNSSCHPQAWARDAEYKLNRLWNIQMPWVYDNTMTGVIFSLSVSTLAWLNSYIVLQDIDLFEKRGGPEKFK